MKSEVSGIILGEKKTEVFPIIDGERRDVFIARLSVAILMDMIRSSGKANDDYPERAVTVATKLADLLGSKDEDA